mmetsp:Transcript_12364/g.31014  ORF Transcript_12364/g.31014 Transcript_12364/m.31014 type:complete len:104 (-) Transcript_12364:585-896(-)
MSDDNIRRGRGPAKVYGTAPSRSQPKRGAADLTRERISDVHRMEGAPHFDDEGNKEPKKKSRKTHRYFRRARISVARSTSRVQHRLSTLAFPPGEIVADVDEC